MTPVTWAAGNYDSKNSSKIVWPPEITSPTIIEGFRVCPKYTFRSNSGRTNNNKKAFPVELYSTVQYCTVQDLLFVIKKSKT